MMAVDADQPVLLAGPQKNRAAETLLRAFADDADYVYVFPQGQRSAARPCAGSGALCWPTA